MTKQGGVNAHYHVWSLARGDYGWLMPTLAPIYRNFSLNDMMPLAQSASVALPFSSKQHDIGGVRRFIVRTRAAREVSRACVDV